MWKSFDYHCEKCDQVSTELVDSKDVPETLDCKCGGETFRVYSVPNITNHSYVDGTDRWAGVKKQRDLKKAARAASRAGNRELSDEISAEIPKVRAGHKGTVETPNKFNDKE